MSVSSVLEPLELVAKLTVFLSLRLSAREMPFASFISPLSITPSIPCPDASAAVLLLPFHLCPSHPSPIVGERHGAQLARWASPGSGRGHSRSGNNDVLRPLPSSCRCNAVWRRFHTLQKGSMSLSAVTSPKRLVVSPSRGNVCTHPTSQRKRYTIGPPYPSGTFQ